MPHGSFAGLSRSTSTLLTQGRKNQSRYCHRTAEGRRAARPPPAASNSGQAWTGRRRGQWEGWATTPLPHLPPHPATPPPRTRLPPHHPSPHPTLPHHTLLHHTALPCLPWRCGLNVGRGGRRLGGPTPTFSHPYPTRLHCAHPAGLGGGRYTGGAGEWLGSNVDATGAWMTLGGTSVGHAAKPVRI